MFMAWIIVGLVLLSLLIIVIALFIYCRYLQNRAQSSDEEQNIPIDSDSLPDMDEKRQSGPTANYQGCIQDPPGQGGQAYTQDQSTQTGKEEPFYVNFDVKWKSDTPVTEAPGSQYPETNIPRAQFNPHMINANCQNPERVVEGFNTNHDTVGGSRYVVEEFKTNYDIVGVPRRVRQPLDPLHGLLQKPQPLYGQTDALDPMYDVVPGMSKPVYDHIDETFDTAYDLPGVPIPVDLSGPSYRGGDIAGSGHGIMPLPLPGSQIHRTNNNFHACSRRENTEDDFESHIYANLS